jgi:WD repeat-containing protein 68
MPQGNTTSVLTYNTGWVANGLSWSARDGDLRIAVASYSQEYKNTIDIVQLHDDRLVCRASWEHSYPPTKVMFSPQASTADLIITTADYLRVWEVREGAAPPPEPVGSPSGHKESDSTDPPSANVDAATPPAETGLSKRATIDSRVVSIKTLDSGKHNEFCSPLTSFDWNAEDPNIVACSSIDTTVAIYDIESSKCTTQLIAHDKDVYDVAFAKGTHTFASCGADGSVRIFDLREMEHCFIVYESPNLSPLLRVTWNKLEATYLATFGVEGTEVVIIDIRFPSAPVGALHGAHSQPINSIGWAPLSTTHIASAGEDCIASIWDLSDLPNVAPTSYLNFRADNPINNIAWSPKSEDWVAITTGTGASLLHV